MVACFTGESSSDRPVAAVTAQGGFAVVPPEHCVATDHRKVPAASTGVCSRGLCGDLVLPCRKALLCLVKAECEASLRIGPRKIAQA